MVSRLLLALIPGTYRLWSFWLAWLFVMLQAGNGRAGLCRHPRRGVDRLAVLVISASRMAAKPWKILMALKGREDGMALKGIARNGDRVMRIARRMWAVCADTPRPTSTTVPTLLFPRQHQWGAVERFLSSNFFFRVERNFFRTTSSENVVRFASRKDVFPH